MKKDKGAIFFGLMTLLAFSVSGQVDIPGEVKAETEQIYYNPFYEEINTLEDCIEWIQSDAEEGLIEGFLAEMYINQFNNVILALQRTPAVTYKQHQYHKEEYTTQGEKDCSSRDE